MHVARMEAMSRRTEQSCWWCLFSVRRILSLFHGYPQYIQGLNTTASLNTLIERLAVAHPELLMSQFLT